MQSNLPAGKPSFGIGYDTTIGWYAWFGHSAQSGVRVPFKMIAKPVKAAGNTSKIAGRAMATNPLFWGAIGVGATVGWIYERRARTKADKARKEAEIAHAFESGRADVAEKDRDEAAAKAEEMKKQIDLLVYSLLVRVLPARLTHYRGYAAVITPSPDEISRIRSAYGINGNDRNIAVCGRVSAGKSAFVNSVRGLLASHPDAAPIDNEETTTEIRGYRDPHLPTIVWWDVPGTGGRTSRDWDYFAEQVLFVFDQIIIVHEQIFSLVWFLAVCPMAIPLITPRQSSAFTVNVLSTAKRL
jgi:hypothetical protein